MKKIFPLLFIAIVVAVFFRPFLFKNLLPVPSDTIIGLYNPFRDLYAKDFPRGIPFKNFLITDPVRQQYPWRFESLLQEKKWQLPLWNPYNFAGTPLLANQQSAALTPFNLLFFVLPFPVSWSLLIVLQPLLAGIFLYFYLRNLKIRLLPSLFGAMAFIFSGFFVSWLEWGTIDATVLWFPLILLSVDKIFGEKKYMWYWVYFLANSIAFFSGHLQTFIYMVLFAHAYIGIRLISSKERVKTILIGLPLGIFTIAITSMLWFPLVQFIFLSGRNADLIISEGWFIPFQHLITFFVPDFFGNPTTLNYWGVWNYAELTGYIGIPALIFAFFVFVEKVRKIEWFFGAAVVIAFLFALPTPLAQLPLVFHIPFLSTAQPTRLLSIIDFSLCVLAAFGMEKFLERKSLRFFIPLFLSLVVFAFAWSIVFFPKILFSTISLENILVAKHNLIFPTSVFAISTTLIVAAVIFRKKQNIFLMVLSCLLLLNIVDTMRFAEKFTPFTPQQYLFPTTKALEFLQTHAGDYRVMETDNQILPPNFSLMYHIQSIDGYDPLYINEYGQLIAALQRGRPDIHIPFGFNRLITPQNYENPIINLLGVKYVLSLNELHSPKLQSVFTEGATHIYKNKDVFPRAFFVESLKNANSQQEAINFLFDVSQNLRKNAIAFHVKPKENLSEGRVTILQYSANKIVIQTENASDGFLILTDAYYPTWHAAVDGKETKIYPTDLALRGIFVPKGVHIVEFRDQLF